MKEAEIEKLMPRHVVLCSPYFLKHHLRGSTTHRKFFFELPVVACLPACRLDDGRKFVAIKDFLQRLNYHTITDQPAIGFYGFTVKSRIQLTKLQLNTIYLSHAIRFLCLMGSFVLQILC